MITKIYPVYPGLRVLTLRGESDTDDRGHERLTPPGTWGHIADHIHTDHWSLVFPSGARILVTESELQDPLQYAAAVPATLEQNLLAFQHGQDHHELSLVDEWMLQLAQTILSDPAQLLQRLARSKNCNCSSKDPASLPVPIV